MTADDKVTIPRHPDGTKQTRESVETNDKLGHNNNLRRGADSETEMDDSVGNSVESSPVIILQKVLSSSQLQC